MDPRGWCAGRFAVGDRGHPARSQRLARRHLGGGRQRREWNAIAIDSAGTIAISYYDRTNSALKYASSSDDGATWSIHTVLNTADDGQFTSIAFLANGHPAISFLTITPSTDPGTPVQSMVQVAIASSASPAADTDWDVTVVSGPTTVSCTEALCENDLVCRADGGCAALSAAPTTDCSHLDDEGVTQMGCASGTRCVSDDTGGNYSCQVLSTGTVVEDQPIVNGLYTSLRATSTGLALVWYDRVRRTLRGSAYDSSGDMWRAAFAIDGLDAVGSGDAGYNADLFVAGSDDWYVVYVDGASEQLKLAEIDGGTLGNATPSMTRSLIDDGIRNMGARHIVGADADVVVTAAGEVRVVYQDATTQEALLAVRAAAATDWTLQGGDGPAPLDSSDSTGFWTCQSLSGDTSHIATWWSNNAMETNGTRVFTIPAP